MATTRTTSITEQTTTTTRRSCEDDDNDGVWHDDNITRADDNDNDDDDDKYEHVRGRAATITAIAQRSIQLPAPNAQPDPVTLTPLQHCPAQQHQ